MTKKYFYNKILMKFFWGEEKMETREAKTRQDKKMIKLDFVFSKMSFLDIHFFA